MCSMISKCKKYLIKSYFFQAKGVSSSVVRRVLHHKDYVRSLMELKRYRHRMRRIGSKKHQIYTIEQEKISLNPYDDKRFILDDGISSLPYGYKVV